MPRKSQSATVPATNPVPLVRNELSEAYRTALDDRDLAALYEILRCARDDQALLEAIEQMEETRFEDLPHLSLDVDQIVKRIRKPSVPVRIVTGFVNLIQRHRAAVGILASIGPIVIVLVLCALTAAPFLLDLSLGAVRTLLMVWLVLFSSLAILFSTRLWNEMLVKLARDYFESQGWL